MPSYRGAVREAELALEKAEKSMQLAKIFMLEVAGMESVDLYMSYEEEMPENLYKIYQDGVSKLLKDEPMQYILGYEWFDGYKFTVNPNVLIPRPETEELVGNILAIVDEKYADKDQVDLVDVGTGSGAIGISLKLEEPKLNVTLTDISEEALSVANENAKNLGAKVTTMCGSMLEPLVAAHKKVDVIACNPPYIPQEQQIEASVKDYEPNIALFGGEDGLYFYRLVFDHCQEVLNDNGFMAFEIGYDQKEALLEEANKRFKNADIEVLKDIFGKDRMLIVNFKGEIR